jgi:hypothetical protein
MTLEIAAGLYLATGIYVAAYAMLSRQGVWLLIPSLILLWPWLVRWGEK